MKSIWKVMLAVCCLGMTIGCGTNPSKNENVKETLPALVVNGTQLMNTEGDTVVLHGVSYGWHQFWPRFYNASSVAYLVNDWGAQVLRASMGVDLDSACYVNKPEFGIECVTKVECIHYIAISGNRIVRCQMDVLVPMRTTNEDNGIRFYGTNRLDNLHFYANTHGQWLRDRADYALGKGLPIFVSECAGMEASGDGPISKEEWGNWLDWMQRHSISWVAWSLSDKDETCSMFYPSASSEGNWKDADMKEWGRMVRDELKK